jgi:predicted small lipoprotein YifL
MGAFDCEADKAGVGCFGMTRLFTLLLATLFLSACGIKGSLATPAPILSKGDPVETVEATEETDETLEEDEPFYGPDFKDPINGDDS